LGTYYLILSLKFSLLPSPLRKSTWFLLFMKFCIRPLWNFHADSLCIFPYLQTSATQARPVIDDFVL
jgi:hypothetical protein